MYFCVLGSADKTLKPENDKVIDEATISLLTESHAIHETSHSVTFYFMIEQIF